MSTAAGASPITVDLYYTTFSGGTNVNKVTATYNGSSSLTLTNNVDIGPGVPGADGIVFTSDGFLAIGGQGGAVYKVNPTTGAFTTQSTSGPAAFHMSVAPGGEIIAASIPGQPVKFNSTLTNNGTPLTFTGGLDSVLDTIIWDNSGQAWYTDSGSGGFGNFGKLAIDLVANTYSTTRTMTNVPAAHGMAFDPTCNTIVLFGDGHISQVDPTGAGTSLLHDLSGFDGTFDQGAVTGQGHIFAANNNGNLTFIDYGTGCNIQSASFMSTQFLAASLDDVAPLVGLGAPNPSPVPEPASLVLLGTGLVGCVRAARRRRG